MKSTTEAMFHLFSLWKKRDALLFLLFSIRKNTAAALHLLFSLYLKGTAVLYGFYFREMDREAKHFNL